MDKPLDKVPIQPDLIGSVYPSLEELRESFICKNNKKLIKKPVYDIDVNV